jgi:type I restriction enzyme M protein
VLFIDASNDYKKEKNQNVLHPEHIEKILDTYQQRVAIDKYSHVATLDEIKCHDYNLNIPRYVDTFEEEEAIDLVEIRSKLVDVDQEIEYITKEINEYLKELGEPSIK